MLLYYQYQYNIKRFGFGNIGGFQAKHQDKHPCPKAFKHKTGGKACITSNANIEYRKCKISIRSEDPYRNHSKLK